MILALLFLTHVFCFEGYTNMVFQCPKDENTIGVCPNNCIVVDPSAIVAGGTAIVAAATLTTLNIAPVLGISGFALMGHLGNDDDMSGTILLQSWVKVLFSCFGPCSRDCVPYGLLRSMILCIYFGLIMMLK